MFKTILKNAIFSKRMDFSQGFQEACKDYAFLRNRGYPDRTAVKLVGDRYRLSREERNILYRGIGSEEESERRRRRKTDEAVGRLHIDGYNVLFTIHNYRMGRPLFLSTDGFLRDVGEIHGRLKEQEHITELFDLVFNYLRETDSGPFRILLDEQMSFSKDHRRTGRELISRYGLNGDCLRMGSVDRELQSVESGCIASSDSTIIDRARVLVFDLSYAVISKAYRASFPDLSDFV